MDVEAENPHVNGWIARTAQGDARAYSSLYDHFEPRLSAYIVANIHPGTARWTRPEEVVAEVFAEVFRNILEEPCGGEIELLRRLKRVAFERIRDARRGTRRFDGESAVLPENEARVVPGSTGPVTRADDLRLLNRLVAALPDEYARVIDLYVKEELDFTVIGKRLGITADAAYRRYARARELIKERWERRRHE